MTLHASLPVDMCFAESRSCFSFKSSHGHQGNKVSCGSQAARLSASRCDL